MATHHWPASGPSRGTVLLVHGLTASSDTWWQVGPALAERGFDVTAVDQAGHGDRVLDGPVDPDVLVDTVLASVPDRPRVLLGHSLGALTTLALLAREPGWADVVVLEDPPCPGDEAVDAFASLVGAGLRADAAAVAEDRAAVARRIREDCPRWADQDVEHAVRGIERADAGAFAGWLEHLDTGGGELDTVARVLAVEPTPYVLAARSPKPFLEGGSAVSDSEREALRDGLPDGWLIEIEGGHCLHRDAPDAWLDAVERIAAGWVSPRPWPPGGRPAPT
jgi:pimeloyl-ACP methyl ester carboxylesterase